MATNLGIVMRRCSENDRFLLMMTKNRHQPGVRDPQWGLTALPLRKTRLNAKFRQENFKVDIFKAEKTGNLRKSTEVNFLRRKSVPR